MRIVIHCTADEADEARSVEDWIFDGEFDGHIEVEVQTS